MASVWLRRLSDVRDVARELFALVGADNEDLRGGITGRQLPTTESALRGGPKELALLPGAVAARRRDR